MAALQGSRVSQKLTLDELKEEPSQEEEFELLNSFTKQVVEKLFNEEEIASIVYKCITSGDFEDKHDIIDDLNDRNKSLLITRISNSIKSNNDILQEEWNDDDNNKLYIILIKIYRDGYLDIEKYDETIFEAQSNPWIDKVIEITQQINETMLKQIPIDKVKKLFMEDSTMTESSIKSLGQQIFTAKAKKYGIKAIHANKIFNMLQTEEDEITSEDEKEFAADLLSPKALKAAMSLQRSVSLEQVNDRNWSIGSKCEIFSNTAEKWCRGEISNITRDDQGEWLTVKYSVDHSSKHKQIQRNNSNIRPLITNSKRPNLPKMRSVPSSLRMGSYESFEKDTARSSTASVNVANVSGNILPQEGTVREEREKWATNTECEVFLRSKSDWVDAKIIKVIPADEHDQQDWLYLRCADGSTKEIEKYSRWVKSKKIVPSPKHRRGDSTLTNINMGAMFDEMMMNTLSNKLQQVLDAINHDIDSSHDFIYQIYHQNQEGDVEKFITYKHQEGMDKYRKLQSSKLPASILCNGSLMGVYGDREACQKCTDSAHKDYRWLEGILLKQLIKSEKIRRVWENNIDKYHQRWLLSANREEVIQVLTDRDLFGIKTVQTAFNLYKRLISTLKYGVVDDGKAEEESHKDMMFLWTKKDQLAIQAPQIEKQQRTKPRMKTLASVPVDAPNSSSNKKEDDAQMKQLDGVHFLYIVSDILDGLQEQFPKVKIKKILLCLHKMKMNGLMFSKIKDDIFKNSIIMYSHSFEQVEIDSIEQLRDCTDELYKQLKAFESHRKPPPSSICNISLSYKKIRKLSHHRQHSLMNESQDEKELTAEEVPIFEQWMITFNSQYNRNTEFTFNVFQPLMKTYLEQGGVVEIINMKYDNYETDLHEKTYDHVLKSFIAWAITLKCANFRCEEKPKLSCFCDVNTFQFYTFNVIMAIMGLKANNDYKLLNILCDTNYTVKHIVKEFLNILNDELRENKYFKIYKLLIYEWINFEFYNFTCDYCKHINKSIMVDRVYQYANTLDSCRICNKRQISRITNNRPQFDIREAIRKKNGVTIEPIRQESEFTLHSLNEYLSKCGTKESALTDLQQYLISEAYDSDAVIDDIIDEEEQSNIKKYIHRTIVDTPEVNTQNYYPHVRKFLNYHRYPTYKQAKLTRYLVLKPKYFSLLKEICLNNVWPLSKEDWEKILPDVTKEYKNKKLRSKVTDKRFGIERGEPIGIHHLISIFLFTHERFTKYRRYFTKSYYLWDQEIHCSNFYWVGRYLFEAVHFFGKRFADKYEHKLFQGIHKKKTFASIAPVFNSPTLTTNDETMARKFAGSFGCTYAFAPKYFGDVDNSKILDAKLFNRNIRMLKGTKVQIQSIRVISPPEDLTPFVMAMQYIEKILLQTEFDIHYYNPTDLYKPTNMKMAYLLIEDKVTGARGTDKDFSPYIRHLFDNWCFNRDFVTFETFKTEMNFMDYKLKEFLFDTSKNKIRLDNVTSFLPNLKHYHDINGILREVSKEIEKQYEANYKTDVKQESFGLLYNCQEHDIPYHIVDALEDIRFSFEKCEGVLAESYRRKLSTFDIDYHSFHDNSKYFYEQLTSVGIPDDIATFLIENIKEKEDLHNRTSQEQFIKHVLNRMEQKDNWSRVKCDLFTQKEAFKKLHSKELKKLQKPIIKRELVTIKDLYDVAKDLAIFDDDNDTAMKLSKYLYIKMMDDKEKVRSWKCTTCHFLNCKLMVDGLWRYYNQASKCGLCGDYRNEMNIDEKDTEDEAPRAQLHRRATMAFLPSYKSNAALLNRSNQPKINLEAWEDIDPECRLFKSIKHLANNQLIFLIENHFIDNISKQNHKKVLQAEKEKVIEYMKEKGITGKKCVEMGRKKFGTELAKSTGNKKIKPAAMTLFKDIEACDLTKTIDLPKAEDAKDEIDYEDLKSDCPALQRLDILLKQFEKMTDQLPATNKIYPHKIRDIFSWFPEYSPVAFLNDIDHIVRHNLKHPQSCKREMHDCIHYKRALRDRNAAMCKTLALKKQFFNTDNQDDFVYISMLDRAHCLLTHAEDIGQGKNKNIKLITDDVTKVSHIPYSTGVYMEYHTLKPLYQNLFDEVVRNQNHEITEEQFITELEAAKLFLKSENTMNDWRACKTDEKYGIKVNEPMHIEHVLCIKFYCNYTQFCNKFRGSYRKNKPTDTNDDIIRRHCNDYYWFGRFLTTAIEFWGERPKKSDNFFHGLAAKFLFKNFSTVYEIPTSTTWDIKVAQDFCNANGIVLKLSPKYKDEVNNSRCLDVSGLSEFQGEKEKLFAGMTVLTITNIYNPSYNGWKGYGDWIRSILYFERIIEQTLQQRHNYNYGVKLDETKQNKFLVPLLKYQMKRNGFKDKSLKQIDEEKNEIDDDEIPKYICTLFGHFCDNKRDYIDLSCINGEISKMHKSLQDILFRGIQYGAKDIVRQYKINDVNIQYIFPNLVEYKNHMSNWICLETQT